MIKNRLKTKLLFLVLFLVLNGAVFYLTQLGQEKRIQIVLDDSLKQLEIQYDILLYNQRLSADAAYASTTLVPGFLRLMRTASHSTKREKKLLREKLQRMLKERYRILKDQGILQYQFVLPNNEVFLRMHRPNLFGDNIADFRKDFQFTNKTHRQSQGFLGGKIAYAFRNVYPIFDNKGEYLGSMEISFSSESVQVYLSGTTKIHAHFLVHKEIFDAKRWKEDDLVLNYMESGESEEYMLTLDSSHTKNECVIQNRAKLQKVKSKISNAIKNQESFAVYAMQDSGQVDVVSFLPITNSKKTQTLAWIVSHKQNEFITEAMQTVLFVRIIVFIVFLIMFYLIYRVIVSKDKMAQEHRFVNDILNSTHDMVFTTDFKVVDFSNKKFKEFFGVKNAKEFNKKMNKDLASIFLPIDGHLHKDLMKENESVYEFIKNTPTEGKTVSILNQDKEEKLFNINITKAPYMKENFYLVTLGDLAKIKETAKRIIERDSMDELTNIFNKNKFEEMAGQELKRDVRYDRRFSIAIIEIENCRELNSSDSTLLGHKALVIFANSLRTMLRDSDIFARYMDNQFVILFPEIDKEHTQNICMKLAKSVEGLTLPNNEKIATVFGITQYLKNDTINLLLDRCLVELANAKKEPTILEVKPVIVEENPVEVVKPVEEPKVIIKIEKKTKKKKELKQIEIKEETQKEKIENI